MLNHFLRHAAYASAALSISLLAAELLLPGSVMTYLFLPYVFMLTGVLQFLAPQDAGRSVMRNVVLIALAFAAIAVVMLTVETAGRAGVALKIAIVALVVSFVAMALRSTAQEG